MAVDTTPLSASQMHAIEVIERIASVLSILGAAFIISTFLLDKAFHKPINRLVFYACWGNLMSNLGTLIATSGPATGVDRPLCQMQGFLIQTFMPADALWTLAMACNVYLTFFHKYTAAMLRSLELRYAILCYGIPFTPAFVYFFIDSPSRGKIYGSAVMWCWISIEWDFLRVAVFYGPAWVVIFVTFVIYFWTGRYIFKKRQLLKNVHQEVDDKNRVSVVQNPFLVEGITKTTEVTVTYEKNPFYTGTPPKSIPSNEQLRQTPVMLPTYNVKIESGSPKSATFKRTPSARRTKSLQQTRMAAAANKAAYSYCKCAMLFFVALIITWVPSSINRVYSLIYPSEVSYGLTVASAFVLPLQGFWNAVIYIVTSLPAVKALFKRLIGTKGVEKEWLRTGSPSSGKMSKNSYESGSGY